MKENKTGQFILAFSEVRPQFNVLISEGVPSTYVLHRDIRKMILLENA